MNIIKKHCRSCEGYEKPMNSKDAKRYLEKILGWKININEKSITKRFEFSDFKEALKFFNKVGGLAEKEGHHPDIKIYSYKKVKISLTTHAINGLSENDFIMASKIDEIK